MTSTSELLARGYEEGYRACLNDLVTEPLPDLQFGHWLSLKADEQQAVVDLVKRARTLRGAL